MIKKLFNILLLAVLISTCVRAQQKPNIIVFMVDDMGWQDTSVPFYTSRTPWNELYRTPNMEKLAAVGIKFTHAYATAICNPFRISLMTGMNAARHKVTNWTLKKNQESDGVSKTLKPSACGRSARKL